MTRILFGLVIGFAIAFVPTSPLEDIYRGYNTITMFEDGSFIAETTDGKLIDGCVKNAICND